MTKLQIFTKAVTKIWDDYEVAIQPAEDSRREALKAAYEAYNGDK